MTKGEALELLVSTKSAPALSRSFITWLYKHGYEIRRLPMDAYSITVRANSILESACQPIDDKGIKETLKGYGK